MLRYSYVDVSILFDHVGEWEEKLEPLASNEAPPDSLVQLIIPSALDGNVA